MPERTGSYWLVGLEDKTLGVRLPVNGPILVGRGNYNHVVLNDSRLSRQHARVAIERGGPVVYDLNSANGTFVNGVPVTRHVLAPNDRVSFGPFAFLLEYEAGADDRADPVRIEDPDDPAEEEGEAATLRPEAIMLQKRLPEESPVRVRLRHDLALAAQIQKSFLPREVIAVTGVELFAEYRAAYQVGGDFYDVFWVGPDRLGVFIGDISGKGISAALLMARISSELRVAALAQIEPVTVLTTMNSATLGRGRPELFFTAIYLTLDVKTGEVLLANAGHPMPYWLHADGTVETITAGRGCAVGILEDPGFETTRVRLGHGDSLVLYTDGVIEAASKDGTLYGQARLEACLGGDGVRPPEVIAEQILRSVDQHTAQGPVNDDLTLFICQRSVNKSPTLQPRRRSSIPIPRLPKR